MTSQPKRSSVVAALALAAALAFWGAWGRRETGRLRQQLAESAAKLQAAQEEAASRIPPARIEEAQGEVAQLRREAVRLRAQVERLEADAARSADSQVTETAGRVAETAAEVENPEDKAENSPAAAFARMFGGEKGEEMAQFSARAAVEMQYVDFFAELGLPAEVEERAREIIIENMTALIRKGLGAAKEGGLGGPQQTGEEMLAELRTSLAEVLNEEELAFWDEYEKTKEERVLKKSFGMQLGMFGMTPEGRELATDVLVEEFIAAKDRIQQDAAAANDARAGIDMQLESLDNARERLAEELPEQQLAHFDRFIEHQRGAMRMVESVTKQMTAGKGRE